MFNVRVAMMFEVFAGGSQAIVEALALNVAKLLRWGIPTAAIVVGMWVVPVLRWWSLGLALLGYQHDGCAQCKSKRWKSESKQLHW
jgi:hypothetical protein